jgi:hypothetical protein
LKNWLDKKNLLRDKHQVGWKRNEEKDEKNPNDGSGVFY